MPTQTIDDLKQQAQTRAEQARSKEKQQADAERAFAAKSERELISYLIQESPLGCEATSHLESWVGKNFDTVVTFELSGHAEIQARYARRQHGNWDKELERWLPSEWFHEGFDETRYDGSGYTRQSPDDKKQWRARAFDRIEWDGEGDAYVPIYIGTDYEDLGDALLAAELAFVDPALIERQLKEANAKKAQPATPADAAPMTKERYVIQYTPIAGSYDIYDMADMDYGLPHRMENSEILPLLNQYVAPALAATTEEKLLSVLKDFVIEYASQTRGEFA